jgi:hypothetical protein
MSDPSLEQKKGGAHFPTTTSLQDEWGMARFTPDNKM